MIQFDDLVLLDVTETAAELGMPRSRVEQLLRADELAGVVHGGRWLVAREEVESFRRRWTPPERVSRAGVSRKFRPPPRPAVPSPER